MKKKFTCQVIWNSSFLININIIDVYWRYHATLQKQTNLKTFMISFFKMLVIIFVAIRIIVIHDSKVLKITQCHSGTRCGRIFRTRQRHSAHSASFSICRWGQSTIKHLLGEQMPSLSTVAKLQFDFVSINGIFKSSTELKGVRTNIYWGSYWNWQARIVYLDSGKRETSTDDRNFQSGS